MIRFFDDTIYTRQINIVQAEKNQSNLLNNIVEFKKSRPKLKEGKDKKEILMKVHMLNMKVEN